MVEAKRFKLLLHPDVISQDGRHFDAKTKERIKKKCREYLSENPEKVGEPLRQELAAYRKLKMFNDYRIIYRVDKKRSTVYILAVGIRRNQEIYQEAVKRLKLSRL